MALFRRRRTQPEASSPAGRQKVPQAPAKATPTGMTVAHAINVLRQRPGGDLPKQAGEFLGAHGDGSAVGPLVEALTERNVPWTVPPALDALDRRGHEVSAELLLAALPRVQWNRTQRWATDDAIVRNAAAVLRARAAGRHVPELARWLHDTAADQALEALPPNSTEYAALRDRRTALRQVALRVLPYVNDRAAVEAMAACERAIRERPAVLRVSDLVSALGRAVHPSSVDVLLRLFADPPEAGPNDVAVLPVLAQALADSWDPRAFEPLVSWVDAGGKPGVLVAFGERGFDALLARVQRADSSIRVDVVRQLALARDPKAVDALLQVLDTRDRTDPDLKAVVDVLGEIGDPRAVDGLLNVLDTAWTTLGADATRALGRIGDARAVDGLVAALDAHDANEPGVPEVVSALGALGDPRPVERLLGVLDREGGAGPLGAPVVRALGDIGDPRAVDPLLTILGERPESGAVYADLIEALAKIGDPRAVPPLSAIMSAANEASRRSMVSLLTAHGDATMLPVLRLADPGPVRLPFFHPENVDDAQQDRLEARKKLHDTIAAFEQRVRREPGRRRRVPAQPSTIGQALRAARKSLDPHLAIWSRPRGEHGGQLRELVGTSDAPDVIDPREGTVGYTWRYAPSARLPEIRMQLSINPQGRIELTANGRTYPATAHGLSALLVPHPDEDAGDPAPPAAGDAGGEATRHKPAGAPGPAAAPATSFRVTEVWDLPSRDGLMVSGRTLSGKIRSGMTLRDRTGLRARVLSLEFLSPRDIAMGEVTIMVERTNPSPVQPQAVLEADEGGAG